MTEREKETGLSIGGQYIMRYLRDGACVLRVKAGGKAHLVPTHILLRHPPASPIKVTLESAHEVMDSGLVRMLEVETRRGLLGRKELGLSGGGDFWVCRQ